MSCGKKLFIQDHALDGGLIGSVRISAGAEAAFPFGGFLVQDMAFIGVCALDLAVFGQVKTLLEAVILKRFLAPLWVLILILGMAENSFVRFYFLVSLFCRQDRNMVM